MKISFTFKNFEPSDHLKNYARTRFEKLLKYMDEDASDTPELQINLAVEKFRHMADVALSANNLHIPAFAESEDMYSTIDLVLDKLGTQVRKLREKRKSRRRKVQKDMRGTGAGVLEPEGVEPKGIIVEREKFSPKPMSVEEAAMQLDNLKYDFLVFLDAQTERVNVIYRRKGRKNRNYGLIDPGM